MSAVEVISEIERLPESEARKVLEWAAERAVIARRRKALRELWAVAGSLPKPSYTEEEMLKACF